MCKFLSCFAYLTHVKSVSCLLLVWTASSYTSIVQANLPFNPFVKYLYPIVSSTFIYTLHIVSSSTLPLHPIQTPLMAAAPPPPLLELEPHLVTADLLVVDVHCTLVVGLVLHSHPAPCFTVFTFRNVVTSTSTILAPIQAIEKKVSILVS